MTQPSQPDGPLNTEEPVLPGKVGSPEWVTTWGAMNGRQPNQADLKVVRSALMQQITNEDPGTPAFNNAFYNLTGREPEEQDIARHEKLREPTDMAMVHQINTERAEKGLSQLPLPDRPFPKTTEDIEGPAEPPAERYNEHRNIVTRGMKLGPIKDAARLVTDWAGWTVGATAGAGAGVFGSTMEKTGQLHRDQGRRGAGLGPEDPLKRFIEGEDFSLKDTIYDAVSAVGDQVEKIMPGGKTSGWSPFGVGGYGAAAPKDHKEEARKAAITEDGGYKAVELPSKHTYSLEGDNVPILMQMLKENDYADAFDRSGVIEAWNEMGPAITDANYEAQMSDLAASYEAAEISDGEFHAKRQDLDDQKMGLGDKYRQSSIAPHLMSNADSERIRAKLLDRSARASFDKFMDEADTRDFAMNAAHGIADITVGLVDLFLDFVMGRDNLVAQRDVYDRGVVTPEGAALPEDWLERTARSVEEPLVLGDKVGYGGMIGMMEVIEDPVRMTLNDPVGTYGTVVPVARGLMRLAEAKLTLALKGAKSLAEEKAAFAGHAAATKFWRQIADKANNLERWVDSGKKFFDQATGAKTTRDMNIVQDAILNESRRAGDWVKGSGLRLIEIAKGRGRTGLGKSRRDGLVKATSEFNHAIETSARLPEGLLDANAKMPLPEAAKFTDDFLEDYGLKTVPDEGLLPGERAAWISDDGIRVSDTLMYPKKETPGLGVAPVIVTEVFFKGKGPKVSNRGAWWHAPDGPTEAFSLVEKLRNLRPDASVEWMESPAYSLYNGFFIEGKGFKDAAEVEALWRRNNPADKPGSPGQANRYPKNGEHGSVFTQDQFRKLIHKGTPGDLAEAQRMVDHYAAVTQKAAMTAEWDKHKARLAEVAEDAGSTGIPGLLEKGVGIMGMGPKSWLWAKANLTPDNASYLGAKSGAVVPAWFNWKIEARRWATSVGEHPWMKNLRRWSGDVKGFYTSGSAPTIIRNYGSNLNLQVHSHNIDPVTYTKQMHERARKHLAYTQGDVEMMDRLGVTDGDRNKSMWATRQGLGESEMVAGDINVLNFGDHTLFEGLKVAGPVFRFVAKWTGANVLKKYSQKAFKAGDNLFKLDEFHRVWDKSETQLKGLKAGEFADMNITPRVRKRIRRTEDGFFMEDPITRDLFKMEDSPSMFDESLAIHSRIMADGKFMDFFDQPLGMDVLRGIPALSVASPYFTFFYKSMDIPFVKKGLVERSLLGTNRLATNSPTELAAAVPEAMRRSMMNGFMVQGFRSNLLNGRHLLSEFMSFEDQDTQATVFNLMTDPSYVNTFKAEGYNYGAATAMMFRAARGFFTSSPTASDMEQWFKAGVHGEVVPKRMADGSRSKTDFVWHDNVEGSFDVERSRHVQTARRLLVQKATTGWDLDDALSFFSLGGSIFSGWIEKRMREKQQRGTSTAATDFEAMTSAIMGRTQVKAIQSGLGQVNPRTEFGGVRPYQLSNDVKEHAKPDFAELPAAELFFRNVFGMGWDAVSLAMTNQQQQRAHVGSRDRKLAMMYTLARIKRQLTLGFSGSPGGRIGMAGLVDDIQANEPDAGYKEGEGVSDGTVDRLKRHQAIIDHLMSKLTLEAEMAIEAMYGPEEEERPTSVEMGEVKLRMVGSEAGEAVVPGGMPAMGRGYKSPPKDEQ